MARRRKKTNYRIGAVSHADDSTVHLLGWGTYVGKHVPGPQEVEGNPVAEVMVNLGVQIPKLKLDDERVVWGFQCWWGPEDKVKEWIGEREVVLVSALKEN
jgi:hypothetical protein